MIGYVRLVSPDELPAHLGDILPSAALGRQGTLHKLGYAVADESTIAFERMPWMTAGGQSMVAGGSQIAYGIEQRAVKIEYYEFGFHHRRFAAAQSNCFYSENPNSSVVRELLVASHKTVFNMITDRSKLSSALHLSNIATLIGGIVILLSLSYDILHNNGYILTPAYLEIQFVVCLVFIADFVLHWVSAERPARFFWRNWIFLLVSIPMLNIALWCGCHLSQEWYLILKAAPLIRAFAAIAIVVAWLVRGRIRMLFIAYLFIVVAFTYLAALIFYCYEIGVNPKVDNFGDSLWWAWMGVTTVGAAVFPVTAIGKVLAVELPGLGMMMFPIFTIYLTNLITEKSNSR